MVALKWSMKHLYSIQQNQTFWAASDIGWVMGHSYIVYGPLLYGATTVLYEGKPVGTPDASAFWRVISENHVSSVFLAPTAVRAIKKEDPTAKGLHKYDVSSLKSVFVAGERCDGATLNWLISLFDNRIPIVDHWWQTETGWPICAKMLGLEHEKNYTTSIQPGSSNAPVCGWDVRILPSSSSEDYQIEQDDHSQLKGDIVVKLPLPPGAFTTLWNNENRFVEAYMKKHFGFYHTGDAGYKDDSENVFVMSRTDDVINVAAHRLSTAVMEDVLCRHVNVVECAVVGMKDEMKPFKAPATIDDVQVLIDIQTLVNKEF
ncbi:propionyl-CoA synthetase [Acrasis kona]|uniref:Propionyl-CoA synthetase n=1 Tax=Acrasis kona TaxID=1008807 RepID=A0AAW2YN00_9EUKA